jgi:inward rectifier potassium channel
MKDFIRNFTGTGKSSSTEDTFRDLGFGTKAVENSRRLLNADGSFNVKRKGLPFFRTYDVYHTLISMSWRKFSLALIAVYLSVNIIFALLYSWAGISELTGSMGQTAFDKFLDDFFLSTQTITTLGYGRISPLGHTASLIAAVEAMAGVLGFAVITGLLYGRFSRPHAKILYSETGVIAPYRGGSGVMFRIANMRSTQLIEAEVQVVLSMLKPDGKSRTFDGIKLERNTINFLALSWTIVHPIDEESPLYGMSEEQFRKTDAEFIVLLKAFDDTFSQTVYSRSSYKYHEIKWGAKFRSIISGDGGMSILDLGGIGETDPAELPVSKEKVV